MWEGRRFFWAANFCPLLFRSPPRLYIFKVVENLINHFKEYHEAYHMQIENLLVSVLIVVILLFTRRILISLIAKNVKDPKTVYNSKRIIGYGYAFLLIILLGSVWITGFGSIGAYLGIASAGIAIATKA